MEVILCYAILVYIDTLDCQILVTGILQQNIRPVFSSLSV